jgi:hypothetical protein
LPTPSLQDVPTARFPFGSLQASLPRVQRLMTTPAGSSLGPYPGTGLYASAEQRRPWR